jgi:peptidyl-prolyl cis-trans isomerase B (cyclophilin B)
VGRAQKLKQQRKVELEKRKKEERKKVLRTVFIVTTTILLIGVTVFLVLLVNHMKSKEGEPKITSEMVLETTKGEIVIGLYGENAPLTVQHVTDLVGQGFYDNLLWYRVEEFVVQTGSHYQSLVAESGEAEPDQAKLEEALTADSGVGTVMDEIGLSNVRGMVGMAKPSDAETQLPKANSATTDFYILKMDETSLDPYFTIFGKVVKGMDVVDSLEDTDVLTSATIRKK